mmetsp:Transcript_43851/g.137774  ORF Transcript_43851/g.137774 Transcript_43851/m.137774 type:complete len:298 (-) Transcript_43851:95-988(-)
MVPAPVRRLAEFDEGLRARAADPPRQQPRRRDLRNRAQCRRRGRPEREELAPVLPRPRVALWRAGDDGARVGEAGVACDRVSRHALLKDGEERRVKGAMVNGGADHLLDEVEHALRLGDGIKRPGVCPEERDGLAEGHGDGHRVGPGRATLKLARSGEREVEVSGHLRERARRREELPVGVDDGLVHLIRVLTGLRVKRHRVEADEGGHEDRDALVGGRRRGRLNDRRGGRRIRRRFPVVNCVCFGRRRCREELRGCGAWVYRRRARRSRRRSHRRSHRRIREARDQTRERRRRGRR